MEFGGKMYRVQQKITQPQEFLSNFSERANNFNTKFYAFIHLSTFVYLPHKISLTSTTAKTWENKQVAQPWQRYRATLALFSISVQLYSQNHKVAF